MISVDTVYKTVQVLINKENNGYLSPIEFNLLGKQAQDEIFREYFEDNNRDQNKENRGLTNKGYANLSFNQRQKINQFAETTTIASTTSTFTLPSDLYFIEHNGVISNNPNSLPRVIEEVERNTLAYLAASHAAPTITYPVYERFTDRIVVTPDTVVSVVLRYIREPRTPRWTYTVVNGVELYNPSSPSAQNFDLHKSEFTNLVIRIMALFGINLRETDVIQVAETMKDKEQIKTNN